MTLSPEQDKALSAIEDWHRSGENWEFRLGGFAGTGKTFLLQHFINSTSTKPICCTPTGKAASVLQSKLGDDAEVSTIHKLLYTPLFQSSPELDLLEKQLEDEPGKQEIIDAIVAEKKKLAKQDLKFSLKGGDLKGEFIIVDEASMVSEEMYNDFKDAGCKVLFVGDPGQLPPVKDKGWFIGGKLDAMLSSVQRQALDSPIIELSMEIREGKVSKGKYSGPDCRILDKSAVTYEDWLSADQVITGRNRTRHKINRFFRSKLGFEGDLPCKGEKLICLKNERAHSFNFINGLQFVSTSDTKLDEVCGEFYIDLDCGEDEDLVDVFFYDHHFRANYDDTLVPLPFVKRRRMRELDFAYAITAHKSQGSEWDSVLIADDKMQIKQKDFRKRWLYTAVTRAKEQLLWVQD